MERPDFVIKPPEQFKSWKYYEKQEMLSDIPVFSKDVRPLILKAVNGQEMSKSEYDRFVPAREEWFFDKYGFPRSQTDARLEIYRKKYAPSEEIVRANELQESLFKAVKDKKESEIEELKRAYEGEYPDQLEGVSALFGLTDFFKIHEKLNIKRYKQAKDKKKEMIESITQYQFLLTHFITANSRDKEFLRTFWSAAEQLAKKSGNLKTMHELRRSVLSQVSALKTFESLGKQPKLSHPREDAFHAIDMWSDEGNVIQIKGTEYLNEPLISETDSMDFPAIEIEDKEVSKYFSTKYSREMRRFKLRLSEYGDKLNKDLKGYFIVIPSSKFDPVTGEPDKEMVEMIRGELSKSS